MKHIMILVFSLFITVMMLSGCEKKEQTPQKETPGINNFENFAPAPDDTTGDDRSPIRYQK